MPISDGKMVVFNFTGSIVSKTYFSWTQRIGTDMCLSMTVRWVAFIISIVGCLYFIYGSQSIGYLEAKVF